MADRYILDANVFIEAHRRYYAFDLCPGFWRALIHQHEMKRVCSIDRVRDELVPISDRLRDWVNDDVPETFFKGTAGRTVADAYRDIVQWVQGEPQFTLAAKAEFAAVADGWVVAYAAANGLVIVTHEEYAPEARNRVPIPNLCVEFGVQHCDTFHMLRDLRVQFVLRTKHKPRR